MWPLRQHQPVQAEDLERCFSKLKQFRAVATR